VATVGLTFYNGLGLVQYRWEGQPLSPGTHTIVFDFTYDGPGVAKGGTGVLRMERAVGSAKIQSTGRCRSRDNLPRQRCRSAFDRAGNSRTGECDLVSRTIPFAKHSS
jgi:hypothetical protein